MHILLIEPDKLEARAYRSALEQAGHTVTHVGGAQSAVHAADERMPDVVVLELQMPGHNGVEFLYEFRSYPEWLHIPVVLHTFVSPGELAHAPTLQTYLGVTRILHKPATSLAMLMQAVEHAAAATAERTQPGKP